jgi:hypothetical protein
VLTYAAGLQAVTIVWIAAKFTEEHRAALDWLNSSTTGDFNFFGLEIELWQIGTSGLAPKFNVVSKPNDWAQSVKEQAAAGGQLTEAQTRHLEYWTQFREYLESTGNTFIPTRPSTSHWSNYPVGRSNFNLVLFNNFRDGRSGVYLLMSGPDAKAHFDLINRDYHDLVEQTLSPLGSVKWRRLPEAKESHIGVYREMSPSDAASWPDLNQWMARATKTLHDLFRPIVKDLNAADWPTSSATADRAAAVPNVSEDK